jgi:hypothetical protein
MKRIAFVTLTLLLIWNLGYCQKSHIELDIHGKKINYFRNLEEELGSTKFNSDQTYISSGNVAQPEIYLRKEKNLPDLLVYYTFFKNDSTISEINYEWDVYNFDKKDNNTQSLDFEKNLIKKYNTIIDEVSAKFGRSKVEGSLDDLSKINSSEGLTRTDTWTPSDTLKIYAYTTISNYFKKDNFVTINPTHRIRLYVYNLKEEEPEKLSAEKLSLLDEKFNSFILLISKDSFEEAQKLFSENIINSVTIDVLKQIKQSIIRINAKLDLYMNGMQIMQDGNIYPMLQYKFSDDANTPPKEYIMVLFDSDNKIIGLRPMKRQ